MSVKKGDRVKVVKGRKVVGTTGVIFWLGPDKFDPEKTKAGINGDDGQKHWIDASYLQVTAEEQAAPAPTVATGDRVTWRRGRATGDGVVVSVLPLPKGPGFEVAVDCGQRTERVLLQDVAKVQPYVLYGEDPQTQVPAGHLLAASLNLRFARVPSDDERRRIAARIHPDVRRTETVLQSTQYLWVPLAAAHGAEALAAAKGWLDDVDAIVPLYDVVYAAAPSQFGPAVSDKRPVWDGLLRVGGAYKAGSVDKVMEAALADLDAPTTT